MLSRDVWEATLPHAVQAIAVGRVGDVLRAVSLRRLFTEAFGLNEADVPILRLDLPGNSTRPFSIDLADEQE
jgi:hypothetical protein